MADEVKLITFAGETVSPLYDGLMQELYTGGGGIITGAVVTIKDASNLHITGGYGALCGREFEIFASDIPVTLSSSGTLKGRLYLHMDLAQSGAPIELLIEAASSLTPVVQDSDVNTTNGVYEVNLATFDVGTSAISNLVDVSPKLSKIPDQISSLNSALTDALVDISDYDILYDGVSSTAGGWQTTSLNSGKKFSDYKFVIVQIMQYGNAYNASVFEPLSVFKTQISTGNRIIVFGDTNVNSQVYYISDTTFGLMMSVVTGGFKTRIYGFMKV